MREGPSLTLCTQTSYKHSQPAQQYYVLAETRCPYLPNRRERKLISELAGPRSLDTYNLLSRAGFRRSHTFAYRPACSGCSACVPVRVAARAFSPSRSLRRVARANANLRVSVLPAKSTLEQYRLFSCYVRDRHDDGDMGAMTYAEYRAMIEQTRVDTRLAEFRNDDGRLVAACLYDWLSDGPSAVYSFFEPALARRSLGTFMILWLIESARAADAPHVYLGYWIAQTRKMSYKLRFRPLEVFGPAGWRILRHEADTARILALRP